MPTPWASYKTDKPESIVCWLSQGCLHMSAGNNPNKSPSIRLNPQNREILVWPASAPAPVRAVPYRLHLPRWRERSVPWISLHPFAMIHLLVTEQVPAQLMLSGLRAFGRSQGSSWHFSTPITEPCPLRTMLGVERVVVSFRTNHDLAITGS